VQAVAPNHLLPRQRLAIILLIAVLGVFYFCTLRQGEAWGDDFAMYIMQARNIASGDWTPPTGYIYNAHTARIGPPAYPPLFPLMLSPVYRIWGLNLTPMKVEVDLCFLAGLYLVFRFLSRYAPFPVLTVIVALLGLSPYFWEIKESVVSDFPFFFFSFLTLCVISACDRSGWKSTPAACAAAACVYLSFATRVAGVVFLPCLLFSSMPQRSEVRRKALFATVASVLLIGVHSFVFRSLGGYVSQSNLSWSGLVRNLVAYSWAIRHQFLGLGSNVFSWAFLLVLLALGGIGLALRLKQGLSLPEVFTISSLLLVLLWTNFADLRYLIPVLPMWFFYIWVALSKLSRDKLSRRRELLVGGFLVATLLGGYASRYSKMDFGPIREGLGNPAFLGMCDYIRGQTPERSVIVYQRPRLLTLVSERAVSAYDEPADNGDLWSYFSSISAGYVLVDREYPDDRDYLEPLLLSHATEAHEARAEGEFHLYSLH
jgi:hypothetical protein